MAVQNGNTTISSAGAGATVADTFAALSPGAGSSDGDSVAASGSGATGVSAGGVGASVLSADGGASAPVGDGSTDAGSGADSGVKPDTGSKDTPAAPRDWAAIQAAYAKGDEKLAKRLARYSSQESALDALIAAQNKIASGQVKTALPEKHSPEELAAWRLDNGVPDTVDGYEIELPEEYLLTENGKSFADGVLKAAHDANLAPAAVQKLFDNIVGQQEAANAAQAEAEELSFVDAKNMLMEEWGNDYKLNSNMVNNLLDTAPEGVKDQLLKGRMEDGTPIGHNVQVLRWLASLAREINPTATVVPGSGETAAATIQTELHTLEGMMGDPESKYNKGPDAKKLQQRYIDLIEAREKYKKRG